MISLWKSALLPLILALTFTPVKSYGVSKLFLCKQALSSLEHGFSIEKAPELSAPRDLDLSPSNNQRPKLRDFIKGKDIFENPQEFSEALRFNLKRSFGFLPFSKSILGALAKVHEIIFDDVKRIYKNGDVTVSNPGIERYIRRELERDPELLRDAATFYSRLKIFENVKPRTSPDSSTVWASTEIDVWAIALKACDDDPRRALRVISVFGHDDATMDRPPRLGNGSDDYFTAFYREKHPRENSPLYIPKSLPYSEIPNEIQTRLRHYRNLFFELHKIEPVPQDFRAGHYHFIGGAFMASELMRAGYGKVGPFILPIVIAENLGLAYKLIAMQKYLTTDGKELMRRGYNRIDTAIGIPKGWTQGRFLKAKLAIDMELTFTELTAYQHRMGAQWAYEVFSKTKDKP